LTKSCGAVDLERGAVSGEQRSSLVFVDGGFHGRQGRCRQFETDCSPCNVDEKGVGESGDAIIGGAVFDEGVGNAISQIAVQLHVDFDILFHGLAKALVLQPSTMLSNDGDVDAKVEGCC
jgi:hypothetical protein